MNTSTRTIKTADAFVYLPSRNTHDQPLTIVYFITGNPGLISYYHEFLSLISETKSQSQSQPQPQPQNATSRLSSDEDNDTPPLSPSIADSCVVAGFSLGGFDQSPSPPSPPSLSLTPPPSNPSISTPATSTTITTQDTTRDDWSEDDLRSLLYPLGYCRGQKKDVYGLRDQIELCYARLDALVAKVKLHYCASTSTSTSPSSASSRSGPDPGPGPGLGDEECASGNGNRDGRRMGGDGKITDNVNVNVILMGHSVGAYIAMEMVRMHHARFGGSKSSHTAAAAASAASESMLSTRHEPSTFQATVGAEFTIASAILLTPTVLNIAHSPSGRLATPLLTYLPFLPTLAQLGSSGLTALLPQARLKWLVSKVTGMKMDSDALEATVGFLGSKGAVRQALYLAGHEMREIGPWKWEDEVWSLLEDTGVARKGHEGREKWLPPRLYFWFAKEDHWVADVTREEIVKMVEERYGEEGEGFVGSGRGARRPKIVVDEHEGLVHAWCIEQSGLVAMKVRIWLQETLSQIHR